MLTRRKLIKAAAVSTAALSLPASLIAAEKKLNILFLGGTGLIGPHAVEVALAQGHNVTLFNRGRSNPGLFSELETIIGDRNTDDINQLSGRKWDVVIDTSAYFPRSVNTAIDALGQDIQQYILISTTSVYTSWAADTDETSPVRTIADPTIEEVRQPATYGALKALCEQAAEAHIPGRVTVIRPGIIVGPGDETDRFTYWPVRVKKGGEMLAPGTGADFVQFIDVRDLSEWIVYCLNQNITGTFNAHTKRGELTMERMLKTCINVLDADTQLTWVPAEFLRQQQVVAGTNMPLWQPGGVELSADKAFANGLQQRPLEETVLDTYGWFSSLSLERRGALNAGISAEKESRVLAAWRAN